MSDYSLYAPSNRKKLLSAAIGQELIELRRYYTPAEMPEDDMLTYDQMSTGSNLISLIFQNGLTIDVSAYSPRYVEAKRSLHSKYKYAVSPNRSKKRYPLLAYKIDQFRSSSLSGRTFHEVLNKEIKDIGILVETEAFQKENRPSTYSGVYGIVLIYRDTSFYIGLGLRDNSYMLDYTTNIEVLQKYKLKVVSINTIYNDLKLPMILSGSPTFQVDLKVRIDNIAKWQVQNLSSEIERVTTETKIKLYKKLEELKNVLQKNNIGILDMCILMDFKTGAIALEEPFDLINFTIKENELFIDSLMNQLVIKPES